MTNRDIEKLASDIITKKLDAKEEVHMEWIVQELLNSQGEILGDGVPFYLFCAREHTYRAVKRSVDKYESEIERDSEDQLTLKGFEHLQRAYTMDREGERVLVPIDLIPSYELLQRAVEYEAQAVAMTAHAKELRDFVALRSEKMSASS